MGAIDYTATLRALYAYLAAPSRKAFLRSCPDIVVDYLTQALSNLRSGVIRLGKADRQRLTPENITTIDSITLGDAGGIKARRKGLMTLGKVLPRLLNRAVIPYLLREQEALEQR